jgi:hypothetical protein
VHASASCTLLPAPGSMLHRFECIFVALVSQAKLDVLYAHCATVILSVAAQLLLRLSACGHKVLLFCTMTRCLDYIEEYLTWRCGGGEITLNTFGSVQGARVEGSATACLCTRPFACGSCTPAFSRPGRQYILYLQTCCPAGHTQLAHMPRY